MITHKCYINITHTKCEYISSHAHFIKTKYETIHSGEMKCKTMFIKQSQEKQ